MQVLIGLDSGLTMTKAVVFDLDGGVVAEAARRVPQIKERPRHVERDMSGHWRASADAIRDALAQAGKAVPEGVKPLAISVAGHGDGVYLLDHDHAPLGLAATSLDSRAQPTIDRWSAEGLFDRAEALTGQRPFAASPAALLAHVRDTEPDRFARIGAVLSCKDWLRFCLTGEVGTDFTEASVSFTDVTTQGYSDAALALYGLEPLRDALPPIHLPGGVAGHLTEDTAAETGLPRGLPVAAGLHDVTACAVGSGVIAPGTLMVIAGTFSINETLTEEARIGPGWFARNGLFPGQWNTMSISPGSSATLDWAMQQIARDLLQTDDPFGALQAELDAIADDPSEIVCLPYHYGSPHPEDPGGAFLGLRGWHGRGHMMRAVAEGIVFNHRHHVDLLDPERRIDRVRLTGGTSRNPWFCQLFADALDRTIEVPATQEAGALGTAICAGLAAGVYADWTDAAARTQTALRTYRPGADRDRVAAAFERYRRTARAVAQLPLIE
ncbi:FGGY-family carbohydrate kinase [Tranquillimonas rosea]|uniref:FGGY-family carbohydrate kinase n=1 Tax=Tranquillimonas rosea TaxID=641238 RepID=UPI003BACB854